MEQMIFDTNALTGVLPRFIRSEKVEVILEKNGDIRLVPVMETKARIAMAKGSLADCPEMAVDLFLERMRADKELE
jgi:hypothetical protein